MAAAGRGQSIPSTGAPETPRLEDPGQHAPVETKKQYVESQLQSLRGQKILANLTVPLDERTRIPGGRRPQLFPCVNASSRPFAHVTA